jgi:hypothetical protein
LIFVFILGCILFVSVWGSPRHEAHDWGDLLASCSGERLLWQMRRVACNRHDAWQISLHGRNVFALAMRGSWEALCSVHWLRMGGGAKRVRPDHEVTMGSASLTSLAAHGRRGETCSP